MYIPSDLVLDILDSFLQPLSWTTPPSQANLDALRNCALVCQEWALPAQKRLFRTVVFQQQNNTHTRAIPVVAKFRSLLSLITQNASFKSDLLARSIRSFTLLENTTFGDPSRYPLLRVSSSEMARFISVCPNLEVLRVKAGVLQFDAASLALLRPAGETNSARLLTHKSKVVELSVLQDRNMHRPYVENVLRTGLFPLVTRLSWTSYTGMDLHSYPFGIAPHSLDLDEEAIPDDSYLPNALTSLCLDFRNTGPPLSLLTSLLHHSHSTIQELRLAFLPPHVPSTYALDSGASLPDLLRLLQPSLKLLALGSQGWDPSSPQFSGLANWTELGPGEFGDDHSKHVLNLREVAPQLETLVCTSSPFEHFLLGFSYEPGGGVKQRPNTKQGRTSRLPNGLKRLEIRVKDSLHHSAWAACLDDVTCAIKGGDDVGPGFRGEDVVPNLQTLLFELPVCFIDDEAKLAADTPVLRQGASEFDEKMQALRTCCTGRNVELEIVFVESPKAAC